MPSFKSFHLSLAIWSAIGALIVAGLAGLAFGGPVFKTACLIAMVGLAAVLALLHHQGHRKLNREISGRRRSEDEIRQFFDLSLDMLCVANTDGYFKRLNPAFERTLGHSREELLARPFIDFVHPDDRASTLAEVEKLAAGALTVSFENRYRTRDGSYRWLNWTCAPQKETGQLFAVARDITEQKAAEQEKLREAYAQLERLVEERTAELRNANEELRSFSYFVSHDLRAPLINIKGYSDELAFALGAIREAAQAGLTHLDEERRQEVELALEEDVPEALGFIGASVSKMDRLINAVLRLSRLGRSRFDLEPLDTEEVVRTTLQSLAHQIETRGAEVTVEPLPEVTADRTALEQIFANLLANAVHYLDPQRPGKIEVLAEANGAATVFYVRDNGRGIAEDDVPRIFEVFRRVGPQDVPGEGMGLNYVQALVRRHGGKIWCESELGRGSTFSFTIPREIPEGPSDAN